MLSLRKFLHNKRHKHSTPRNIYIHGGNSTNFDSSPSINSSISNNPSQSYPFTLDPKLVNGDRHDSHPKHLPSLSANVNEVQYFLYTLLTSKSHKCAKRYPEWVIETCVAWSGSGDVLHFSTDEQLRNICPPQASVSIKHKAHRVGSPCPPMARVMIGEVVAKFVQQQRNKDSQVSEIRREWEAELRRAKSTYQMKANSCTEGLIESNEVSCAQSLASSVVNATRDSSPAASNSRDLQSGTRASVSSISLRSSIHDGPGCIGRASTFSAGPRRSSLASSDSSVTPLDSLKTTGSHSTAQTSHSVLSHGEPRLDPYYSQGTPRPHSRDVIEGLKRNRRLQIAPEIIHESEEKIESKRTCSVKEDKTRHSPWPSRYKQNNLGGSGGHAPQKSSLLRTSTNIDRNGYPAYPSGSHMDPFRRDTNISSTSHERHGQSIHFDNSTHGTRLKNSIAGAEYGFRDGDTTLSNIPEHPSREYVLRHKAHTGVDGGMNRTNPTSMEYGRQDRTEPHFKSSVSDPTFQQDVADYGRHRPSNATSLQRYGASNPRGNNINSFTQNTPSLGESQYNALRPLNNYKVDGHALSHGEYLLSKGMQYADQRSRIENGDNSRPLLQRRQTLGHNWEESSDVHRSVPSRHSSSTCLVTRKSRATLFEMLEERERWEGKAQRGKQSGTDECWKESMSR